MEFYSPACPATAGAAGPFGATGRRGLPLRPTRRAALLAGLGLILAPPARAAGALRLVLATATPGGGFPAFGETFAGAIAAADPALTVERRATGGSSENVGLLRAGRVDLGLVQGSTPIPPSPRAAA